MNPFEAALTALNVSLAQLDYVGEDCDGVKKSMGQIKAAIQLLEVAGKVDKEDMNHFLEYWHIPRNSCPICQRVDALLAAIPDPPAGD